jgi:hypothetical protein
MSSYSRFFLIGYLAIGGCLSDVASDSGEPVDGNEPASGTVEQDLTQNLVDVHSWGGNLFAQDHPYATTPSCDPGSVRALAIPTTLFSSALGGSCAFTGWVTSDNPKDCRANMLAHTNGGFSGASCETHVVEKTGDFYTYTAAGTSSATVNTIDRSIFLQAGQTLIIGTCGVPGESFTGDTFLRLLGPSGAQVAANDDSCGGLGSQIVFIVPTSGVFQIRGGCFSSSTCRANVTWTID